MERSTALLRLPLSTSLRPSTSPSTRSLLRLHPLASRSSPSSSTHSRRTISTTSHLRPQSCGRFSTLSPSLRSRCSAFSTSSSHRALTEPLSPSPEPQSSSPTHPPSPERREVPAYEITFTCKPCLTRATHKISKQGYHYGTVLITCPSCKARHLISDHLKVRCSPEDRYPGQHRRETHSES